MSSSLNTLPLPVPDLSGKVYIVTGGNAGIGYQAILQLVSQHAKVYMGCRSEKKGRAAASEIKAKIPDADVQLLIMDLTDLTSVVKAAKEFLQYVISIRPILD